MLRRLLAGLVVVEFLSAYAVAQPAVSLSSSEIKLSLMKLRVLGSVLYVAAHPDDENTAFLTTMARGRLYRTAYLSITRGEGGQNLLGSEQGHELGLIRTQELLAARRVDGAEQYFTRAIDFGYSKSTEETLRIWGEERTLADVVWVIRSFRPDVVVTRFTPLLGGHGNHTASAVLARKAFDVAGDSSWFPDQLRYVRPWRPTRILWNVFRTSAADTSAPTVQVDLGAYSPLLGRSFTELAGVARTMHKSQGFGAAQNRGQNFNSFQHVAGNPARSDVLDGVPTSWERVGGGRKIDSLLAAALAGFDEDDPSGILPLLFEALRAFPPGPADPWFTVKRRELLTVIRACTGLWAEATTDTRNMLPGERIQLTWTALNRSAYPLFLDSLHILPGASDTILNAPLNENRPLRGTLSYLVPPDAPYGQPPWLRTTPERGAYDVADIPLRTLPDIPPPITVRFFIRATHGSFALELPVEFRYVDPVQGEIRDPCVIVPPVSLKFRDPVTLVSEKGPGKVSLAVTGLSGVTHGHMKLVLPPGWKSVPERIPFQIGAAGDEQMGMFQAIPGPEAKSGHMLGEATIGTATVRTTTVELVYPHIPRQTYLRPASAAILRLDVRKVGDRIGYIMGAGDDVPDALRQMGYQVDLLSDADLEVQPLDGYHALVAGVRAYNTRSKLRTLKNRLLDYVKNGGTYIVQYVTPQRGEADNIGPYPLSISRDRVTEEDAPVGFLAPAHPILTAPNRITQLDFEGWVQERGLYFAGRRDPKYDSVLVSADTGEPPRGGGLITARYGKGWFVYTGYAFFRQLPAGVEGAFRLFANIVSLHSHERTAPTSR